MAAFETPALGEYPVIPPGARRVDGPEQAVRGEAGHPEGPGLPGRARARLGEGRGHEAGRARVPVARAAGVPRCLREVRRVHRQVPLLPRHRGPEEHARGAPGPAALGLPALLHLRRQAFPEARGRARHDQGSAGRLVQPTSTSARSAGAARCSVPTASTPPRSPWRRATSWTPSGWGRSTPTRSSARSTRSATTWAFPSRRCATRSTASKRT